MPAATSDPFAAAAHITGEPVYVLPFTPTKDNWDLQIFANEEAQQRRFKLASVPNLASLLEKGVKQIRGDDEQRDVVKQLLEKRFGVDQVKVFLPDEKDEDVVTDIQTSENQFKSLKAAQANLAWEFTGYNSNAFFFDLGDFRFRCTAVLKGQQINLAPKKRNVRIVGFYKALEAPQWSFYIGIAEVDLSVWHTVAEPSSKRLKKSGPEQEDKTSEDGAKAVENVGA
ncbi:hypothetical protein ACQY0O_006976 [Thecaphora frezii]